MPHLISIAVESPAHYVALDSQSNTWRGHFVTGPGGSLVITWMPVSSKFQAQREPVSSEAEGAPSSADLGQEA
jgi:hypothetical protein